MCRFERRKREKKHNNNNNSINSGDIKTQDIMSGHTTLYCIALNCMSCISQRNAHLHQLSLIAAIIQASGFEYERFCRFDSIIRLISSALHTFTHLHCTPDIYTHTRSLARIETQEEDAFKTCYNKNMQTKNNSQMN